MGLVGIQADEAHFESGGDGQGGEQRVRFHPGLAVADASPYNNLLHLEGDHKPDV
jgi:hypothetical protein